MKRRAQHLFRRRVARWWTQCRMRPVFAAEPELRARLAPLVPDRALRDAVVLEVFTSMLQTALRAARSLRAARPIDDDLRRLSRLVADWPTPMRRVFTLRKVYGLRPGDIARRLNLTDAEVEQHLIAAARACARVHGDRSSDATGDPHPADPPEGRAT
jgi:DNA-directed RNA polymerase specialized sigma24 family protein